MWYPRGKSSFLSHNHQGMYRCEPPMPSESCRGIPTSAGTRPPRLNPVLSIRFRPTTPEEFASPFEWRGDREFGSSRVDSQVLAASTTVRQRICFSVRVVLSMRSEEHTSELQSRFGISYAVFCLKKKVPASCHCGR